MGRLGRRLARRLHREHRVIGIDRRPFDGRPKDIEHHQIDIRRKKTRDVFRSTPSRAVVHLGVMHDPRRAARASTTRGTWPASRGSSSMSRITTSQAGAALERQRLRAAPRQSAVPDRGRAAPRRRRPSARSAISSRSTCWPSRSSGSARRPRRSSCGRCTSSAPCATRPPTTSAST